MNLDWPADPKQYVLESTWLNRLLALGFKARLPNLRTEVGIFDPTFTLQQSRDEINRYYGYYQPELQCADKTSGSYCYQVGGWSNRVVMAVKYGDVLISLDDYPATEAISLYRLLSQHESAETLALAKVLVSTLILHRAKHV